MCISMRKNGKEISGMWSTSYVGSMYLRIFNKIRTTLYLTKLNIGYFDLCYC